MLIRWPFGLVLLVLVVLAGCSGDEVAVSEEPVGSAEVESAADGLASGDGEADTASSSTSTADSGTADSGTEDSTPTADAADEDSSTTDSAAEDSSPADSGSADSSSTDSATADSANADSATADSASEDSAPIAAAQVLSAHEVNDRLGAGINLGNSLEAPREGDWGASLDESFFSVIADAGFDHVRLPVSWAEYAGLQAPYTIPDGNDPAISGQPYSNIWERVDWAVDQAEANDLMIIVNMHHYEAAHTNPAAHSDRLIGMWRQIAAQYADAGDHVVFELFNEPNAVFTEQPELWNDLLVDLLAVVRETNPTRPVIIGPVGLNSIDFLDELVLPDDDNLIATVHLYEPFAFTHQGADWVADIPPIGARWSPDGFGLVEGISDLSWDTQSSIDDGQLRVDFGRQWAGFSLDYFDEVGLTEVRFGVRGEGSLQVGCRAPNDDELDEAFLTTTNSVQQVSVDLTTCSPGATGISIMNSHPSSEPLFFDSMTVCSTTRGCEAITSSADASLRRWVQRASEWSEATGVPVHIGEFGAFSAGGQVPVADRAAWTATITDEAEALGLSFAYWEFHAGFGAYDLEANAWNAQLLDALVG